MRKDHGDGMQGESGRFGVCVVGIAGFSVFSYSLEWEVGDERR